MDMNDVTLNNTFDEPSPSEDPKSEDGDITEKKTDQARDSNNNQEFTVRLPFFTVEEYHESGVSDYDDVIDVRTPLEFAEDRIPGSLNWPVLSNEERVTVGALYAK